jgi:hypothetical protein
MSNYSELTAHACASNLWLQGRQKGRLIRHSDSRLRRDAAQPCVLSAANGVNRKIYKLCAWNEKVYYNSTLQSNRSYSTFIPVNHLTTLSSYHSPNANTYPIAMSSSNTVSNDSSALPRYSTSAPPPYTSSDANSLTSTKSTSKSILEKIFNRKCKACLDVVMM